MADDKNLDPITPDAPTTPKREKAETKTKVLVAASTFVWAATPAKGKKAVKVVFEEGKPVDKLPKDVAAAYLEKGLVKKDFI